jgi:fatty-acyl-CoA synthase
VQRLSYFHRGGEAALIGSPIGAWLREVASRHAEREALVSIPQGVRLRYGELFARVAELARGLIALGVKRGTRVGIWATDNVEWVLLQLATADVGAVLVNVNPANRAPELAHALRAARVEALFLMPSFRSSHYVEIVSALCPEVARAEVAGARPDALRCAEAPDLRRLVVFDPEKGAAVERPAAGFLPWPELLEGGRNVSDAALEERARSLDADDPINIQFTSGTTGFPKPVVLTHHNLLNNGHFIGEVMGLDATDRLCVPVPFYHCFGMVVSNLACLTHGACVVIPAPHFDAGATLHAIESERCTAVHGVPTMFVAELERPDFGRYDLSSLRTGIMAGAPCPPELLRRVMEDMGCREILVGYGQTEASPLTHCTRAADSFERRVETVGTNLPHQEAKVVDATSGAVVPLGAVGEICFRGYHVMRGYFGMPEETRAALDEAGWLHSGDLGSMDAEGYVRITGRLKDMIIRGGENVYPAEVEAWYARHPKVAQVAVFGIPDPRWGEQVGAWIQLHEGQRCEQQQYGTRLAHRPFSQGRPGAPHPTVTGRRAPAARYSRASMRVWSFRRQEGRARGRRAFRRGSRFLAAGPASSRTSSAAPTLDVEPSSSRSGTTARAARTRSGGSPRSPPRSTP